MLSATCNLKTKLRAPAGEGRQKETPSDGERSPCA